MRPLLIALTALALSACATSAKFEAKMNRFVGQPEGVIVGTYGPPQSSYVLHDGSRVLQYTRGSKLVLPGMVTSEPVQTNTRGNMTLNQGMRQTNATYTQQSTTYAQQQGPATTVQLWCTVIFTIDTSNLVKSWSANGNHCVAD